MELSSFDITIECPKCNYGFYVNLQDVKLESAILCHNCKVEIKLRDSEASVYAVENSLNDLRSQLNNLFKK